MTQGQQNARDGSAYPLLPGFPMRISLIHNEQAGEGEVTADELVEAIHRAGHDAASFSTRAIDAAMRDPGDLIVVAGGDGTVGSIAKRMAGRGVLMTIIPVGTANNIATSLGLARDWRELICGWKNARRQIVDIASVSGPEGNLPFIESVGCGFIADAMVKFDKDETLEPNDKAEEIAMARRKMCQVLESTSPRPCRITLDDQDMSGDFLLAEIMNFGRIGPGVLLSADADPGDGLLELILMTESDRDVACEYLTATTGHADARFPPLRGRRGRRIQLDCAGANLHIDDEAPRSGPITACAADDVVPFLVPGS